MRGKVWRYGDHVNTDLIIPGRYLDDYDPKNLAKHAMEDIDPGFAKKVAFGDIIVAGRNFGCGSSREQAPVALKVAGVGAVVSGSFARIFYRNAINIGLPVIECPEAFEVFKTGDVALPLVVMGQVPTRLVPVAVLPTRNSSLRGLLPPSAGRSDRCA